MERAEVEQYDGFVANEEIELEQMVHAGDLPDDIIDRGDAGDAARDKLYTYAQERGYGEEEINYISARDVNIIHKAMMFDNAQNQIAETKKVARRASPVMRPGTRFDARGEKRQAARSKFAKTGSLADAARVIENL